MWLTLFCTWRQKSPLCRQTEILFILAWAQMQIEPFPESLLQPDILHCAHTRVLRSCMRHQQALAAPLSHKCLQLTLFVLFSVVCSLDEPSVQEFEAVINKVLLFVLTLFLLEVSRFLFDCTSRPARLFADEKCKWEIVSFILANCWNLWNNVSVSPNRIMPLLLPDSVTDATYSMCPPSLQQRLIWTAATLVMSNDNAVFWEIGFDWIQLDLSRSSFRATTSTQTS